MIGEHFTEEDGATMGEGVEKSLELAMLQTGAQHRVNVRRLG